MESKRWDGANYLFAPQAAGSSALNYITAADTPPETLLRLRGEVVCYLDGTAGPGILVEVGLGIALVPEGSSTTVLWSPLTDVSAPWWMYERFSIGYEEMVTDVVSVQGLPVFRRQVDVKGMRIIRPDVEAQIVIEVATLLTTDAVNLSFSSRVLFGST